MTPAPGPAGGPPPAPAPPPAALPAPARPPDPGARPGPALELLVHGVGGATPDGMLADPYPVRVLGDETAGLYRRRSDVQAQDHPQGRRRGPLQEAYCWSGLTSGDGTRALWLLLLPFMVVNLAHWMRPPAPPGRPPGRTGAAYDLLLRLLALVLTVLLAAGACEVVLDLAAWQCAGSTGCASHLSWLRFAADPHNRWHQPGRRLVLGALPPLALVALLGHLSHRTWSVFEAHQPGGVRAAGRSAAPMEQPGFWYGKRPVGRLRIAHLAAALATVGAALTAPALRHDAAHGGPHPVLLGAGVLLAVLLAAVAAAAVAVTAGSSRREHRPDDGRDGPLLRRLHWAALALCAAALPYSGWGRGDWTSSGPLPGAGTVFTVLTGAQLLLVLGLAAVTALLARAARSAAGAASAAPDGGPGRSGPGAQGPGAGSAPDAGADGPGPAGADGPHKGAAGPDAGTGNAGTGGPGDAGEAGEAGETPPAALAGPPRVPGDAPAAVPPQARRRAPDPAAPGSSRAEGPPAGPQPPDPAAPAVHGLPSTGAAPAASPAGPPHPPPGASPAPVPPAPLPSSDGSPDAPPDGPGDRPQPLHAPGFGGPDGPALRGFGGPVTAGLACGLAVLLTSGAVVWASDWLNRGAGPGERRDALPGPPPLLIWHAACFPVVLLAAAALLLPLGGRTLLQQRRLARRVPAAYGLDPAAASPERSAAVAGALARARLTDSAPALLCALALLSLAACAGSLAGALASRTVPAVAARGTPVAVSYTADAAQALGSWLIGTAVVALVTLGRRAYKGATARRTVGILWDVGTFWPRAAHPFAPPCYAERAVPDLVARIRAWCDRVPDGRIVVSAHSQGTVIAAAALWQLPGPVRRRVGLLTYGSPLHRLYGRFFPACTGPADLDRLHRRTRAWRNLYRYTDPIGGPVRVPAAPGEEPVDAPPLTDPPSYGRTPEQPLPTQVEGHSHYQADPAFAAEREALLDRLDRLDRR
ncbi:hypothetical protein [Streptomyces sp. NPDC001380]|uniref:hypothetical protein n=1 Tax=Streptomyces sp. NPDC001380 TaxID=3364566 RepID=UPI003699FA48